MQEADYQAVQALSRSLGRNAEPARFGVEGCQLVLKDSQDKPLGWAKASWWDPDDELAPAGFYLSGVEIATDFQQRRVGLNLDHRATGMDSPPCRSGMVCCECAKHCVARVAAVFWI